MHPQAIAVAREGDQRRAEVVEAVVDEMVANEILDDATWSRLRDRVATPLRELQLGPLEEARQLAEEASATPEPDQPAAMRQAGAAARTVVGGAAKAAAKAARTQNVRSNSRRKRAGRDQVRAR